ncbi:hypothetical protein K474DRAFT_1043133 [Panus rudis PR-1116 ss-1]|nr:hypothetical protein K474DRAFT_1043133 [Panus rudis PR-1116 ss-1]
MSPTTTPTSRSAPDTKFMVFGSNSHHRQSKSPSSPSTNPSPTMTKPRVTKSRPQSQSRISHISPASAPESKPKLKLKELKLAKLHPLPALYTSLPTPETTPEPETPKLPLAVTTVTGKRGSLPTPRVPAARPAAVRKVSSVAVVKSVPIAQKVKAEAKDVFDAKKSPGVVTATNRKTRAQLPSPPPSPPVEIVVKDKQGKGPVKKQLKADKKQESVTVVVAKKTEMPVTWKMAESLKRNDLQIKREKERDGVATAEVKKPVAWKMARPLKRNAPGTANLTAVVTIKAKKVVEVEVKEEVAKVEVTPVS